MSKIELLCEQIGLTEQMLELVVKGAATLEYKHCCFLIPKNATVSGVVMNGNEVFRKVDVDKTPEKPLTPKYEYVQPDVTEIAMKAHETEVEQESITEVEPNDLSPREFGTNNLFEASTDGIIEPSATVDSDLPPWPEPENGFSSNGVTLPSGNTGSESAVVTTPKRTEDPDWMKSHWE